MFTDKFHDYEGGVYVDYQPLITVSSEEETISLYMNSLNFKII